MKCILALDPGSDKVGFALVKFDLTVGELGIVRIGDLPATISRVCTSSQLEAVVLGSGTRARETAQRITSCLPGDLPVHFEEEKNTTYEARARFFRDHPPTGWRRLLPLGLQVPPRPLDDYAAWLIGERYLVRNGLAHS